ncbi:hypothetical protein Tco_0557181 [Tanacetum coccineum]
MEVEPLNHTKLEDLGLNTCSHDLFHSSKEVPSVDESEPQLLPNFPFLDGASGSMEFRNEKMQTPIPTPTRSPRKDLSSDKTISKELTATVSPTTATTSKDSSTSKRKKQPISYDDIK